MNDAQGVGGSSPSRPTHNRRSEACSVVVFSTSALWEQRWEQPAESLQIVLKQLVVVPLGTTDRAFSVSGS